MGEGMSDSDPGWFQPWRCHSFIHSFNKHSFCGLAVALDHTLFQPGPLGPRRSTELISVIPSALPS